MRQDSGLCLLTMHSQAGRRRRGHSSLAGGGVTTVTCNTGWKKRGQKGRERPVTCHSVDIITYSHIKGIISSCCHSGGISGWYAVRPGFPEDAKSTVRSSLPNLAFSPPVQILPSATRSHRLCHLQSPRSAGKWRRCQQKCFRRHEVETPCGFSFMTFVSEMCTGDMPQCPFLGAQFLLGMNGLGPTCLCPPPESTHNAVRLPVVNSRPLRQRSSTCKHTVLSVSWGASF